MAATLAKAEMYAGIAQKLNRKKAVVRLNLLRLVRNIMDGCEADSGSMAAASSSSTGRQLRLLFDDIQTLAAEIPPFSCATWPRSSSGATSMVRSTTIL